MSDHGDNMSNGRRAGRPSGLTPGVAAKILTAVRGGNHLKVACRFAGVATRTFNGWCKRGREEESGPYRDFWLDLQQAETEAEIKLVLLIMKAAGDDPK